MATLRKKRKLAAVSRETQESATNSQSQNTFVPGMTEGITHVSKEIESKFTKKLSRSLAEQSFGCSVQNRRISSDHASTDMLRNRSGNIPEQGFRKPGTHWRSFRERSLSQSGVLCSSSQQFSWLRPGTHILQYWQTGIDRSRSRPYGSRN